MTHDYDFYLSPEPEDFAALKALAKEKDLHFSSRNPGKRPCFSLLSDTQKLDYFRCRSYLVEGARMTFAEMYARKQVIPVEDFEVYVPSIEDLIRTKKIRKLPRDREDIKYLQVLLEREER